MYLKVLKSYQGSEHSGVKVCTEGKDGGDIDMGPGFASWQLPIKLAYDKPIMEAADITRTGRYQIPIMGIKQQLRG